MLIAGDTYLAYLKDNIVVKLPKLEDNTNIQNCFTHIIKCSEEPHYLKFKNSFIPTDELGNLSQYSGIGALNE